MAAGFSGPLAGPVRPPSWVPRAHYVKAALAGLWLRFDLFRRGGLRPRAAARSQQEATMWAAYAESQLLEVLNKHC